METTKESEPKLAACLPTRRFYPSQSKVFCELLRTTITLAPLLVKHVPPHNFELNAKKRHKIHYACLYNSDRSKYSAFLDSELSLGGSTDMNPKIKSIFCSQST